MPKLIEVCIEKDAILGRQISPWIVECGLSPTDSLHRGVAIDAEEPALFGGAGIVLHPLDDLGAA